MEKSKARQLVRQLIQQNNMSKREVIEIFENSFENSETSKVGKVLKDGVEDIEQGKSEVEQIEEQLVDREQIQRRQPQSRLQKQPIENRKSRQKSLTGNGVVSTFGPITQGNVVGNMGSITQGNIIGNGQEISDRIFGRRRRER